MRTVNVTISPADVKLGILSKIVNLCLCPRNMFILQVMVIGGSAPGTGRGQGRGARGAGAMSLCPSYDVNKSPIFASLSSPFPNMLVKGRL